jgi:drug/metabolite transporter (DMT)-like permease
VRLAQPAPPLVMGFYRMLFAALAMGAWLVLARRPIRLGGRGPLLALAAGVCFGADIGLWKTSVTLTTIATATLLVNLTPVHVGLYTAVVRRQRLDPTFVAGGALALAGAAVLLGEPGGGERDLLGALLAIAASVFFAAYIVVVAEARREVDVVSGFFLVTVASGAVLGGAALVHGDGFAGFPATSWAAMLGAAGISQLGGVLGVVWALRYLPATLASVGLLGQPVIAALLAWWLLAEPMSAVQMLGALGVLVGIGVASRAAPPRPRAAPAAR